MNVGSLVIYDDGKLLHTAKVMRLEEKQAIIRIFRTAQADRVVTVSREQLSVVHEQEKPA